MTKGEDELTDRADRMMNDPDEFGDYEDWEDAGDSECDREAAEDFDLADDEE
ncbi:MAG: hypothetical protein ACJAYU_001520 [Bradymonadia bacterium]|jgi:hypothetical protein